jgi:hypothetical protein
MARVGGPGHRALQASLDLACAVPPGSGWGRKPAAHAGFFTALADASQNACVTPVLRNGAEFAFQLMLGAGSIADGIVISSRRRMLASLRSGNLGDAALELGAASTGPELHGTPVWQPRLFGKSAGMTTFGAADTGPVSPSSRSRAAAPDPVLPLVLSGQPGSQLVVQR